VLMDQNKERKTEKRRKDEGKAKGTKKRERG
jgi:hypothetical protein